MLLNISISKPIKEKITTYSSGLPSITHQLALYMCQEAKILKTQKTLKNISDKLLEDSVEYYLDENSDTLKSVYDSATKDIKKRKFESPKTILSAILLNKSVNQTPREIALGLKKIYSEYRPNNLKKYLDELTKDDRGEILRYDKNSDTYSFSTPFLRAYAHCMLDKSKTKKIISQAKLLKELKLILRSELERAQERFIIDFSMDRIGYDDLDESSLPNEDMI